MKGQTYGHLDSALDTLKHYNQVLKRNAWLERGEYENTWRVVWQ